MAAYLCRDDEISALCLELSMLLHAGIDSAGGLTMAAEETLVPDLKALLISMSKKMDSGMPLSRAIKESGAFPHTVSAMLQVGERTGRSEEALKALAIYYDKRSQANSRLRSALLYPSILFVIILAVISVLLIWVLPIFQQVYENLGGSLAGLAGGLLQLGQWLTAAMPIILIIIGIIIIAFCALLFCKSLRDRAIRAYKRSKGGKGLWGLMAKARFAQGLSMCLASGLQLEDALHTAAELLDDEILYANAEKAIDLFRNGESLSHALSKTELLPPSQCRLLELGFAGGTGEAAMEEIARRLDIQAAEALERTVSRVEPAMVITCSLLVASVLLSVMLPLINIMSNIG